MSSIETYYLIDFENVHEDGLSGSEHLGSHDHVHLFSTKNAPKISIEKLACFNATNLSTHETPIGNQSLDMHLVSYLGYLIGANKSNCKYVIISKDTDYDKIISFWKDYNNSHITRQNQIELSKKLPHQRLPTLQILSAHLMLSLKKQLIHKLNVSLIQKFNSLLARLNTQKPLLTKPLLLL